MDLIARIDGWSRSHPERPAHIASDGVLTYSELGAASDALAAHLGGWLPDGAPVVVYGHKERAMLPAFLGCLKAGHAYVPVDVSVPVDRARRILERSGTRCVISPSPVPAELVPPDVRVLAGAELRAVLASGERPAPDARVAADDDCYVIFTSGSTGEPKGVRITLAALTTFVEWMLAEQRLAEAAEVFLNQAPFSFDLSVMDLYLSLATGGTLFSVHREMLARPADLFAALYDSGVTAWVSTPSFAEMCLAEPTFAGASLPKVRRFLFDGETLPNDLVGRLFERFPGVSVWNLYGPTEATVAITSVEVTPGLLSAHRPLPVGRVAPGSRIDFDGGSDAGEIVIVGPTVSAGYLGDAARSARSFAVDPETGHRTYRTGDAGHRIGDLVFYDGRLDFQVKVHGHRIELGDVEANLCRLPEVRNAVVLPVRRDERVEHLKAFVVLDGGRPADSLAAGLELKRRLGGLVPEYMVPRRIAFVDAFPMTPNGKIDRRALAEGSP